MLNVLVGLATLHSSYAQDLSSLLIVTSTTRDYMSHFQRKQATQKIAKLRKEISLLQKILRAERKLWTHMLWCEDCQAYLAVVRNVTRDCPEAFKLRSAHLQALDIFSGKRRKKYEINTLS